MAALSAGHQRLARNCGDVWETNGEVMWWKVLMLHPWNSKNLTQEIRVKVLHGLKSSECHHT